MKKNFFALLHTMKLVVLLPTLSVSLVACEPENDEEGVPVDLGLSVKWASCNVGAESLEDYGNYYAWGGTSPTKTYYESDCFAYDLSFSELKSRGIIGSDGNLSPKYDAATANWGSAWRMPTREELDELRDRCTWSMITVKGVQGYKVKGPSGNAIFLPAAGYRIDASLSYAGSRGSYWSSTYRNEGSRAYELTFSSYGYERGESRRNCGYTVRPVLK